MNCGGIDSAFFDLGADLVFSLSFAIVFLLYGKPAENCLSK